MRIVMWRALACKIRKEDAGCGVLETIFRFLEERRDLGAKELGNPGEGTRSVQHGCHLKPAAWHCVAECMHDRFRRRAKVGGRDKKLAGRSQRQKGRPFIDSAQT